MKMKEFGPGGRSSLAPPLDPPMDYYRLAPLSEFGIGENKVTAMCFHSLQFQLESYSYYATIPFYERKRANIAFMLFIAHS